MKNYWKSAALAVAALLAVNAGSSLLSAQLTPPATPPATGAGSTAGTTRGERGGSTTRGEGRSGERQPHMAAALMALQRAREQLDLAVHDKGGFREAALKDVDGAIVDVKDGMKYAIDHPEEYGRGERGARGGTTTGTSTAPSTVPSTVPKT